MMRQAAKLALLREACKFVAIVLVVGLASVTCLYLVEKIDLEPGSEDSR